MEKLLRKAHILNVILTPEEDVTHVTIKGEATEKEMYLTIKSMVKALSEIIEVKEEEILLAQLFEVI